MSEKTSEYTVLEVCAQLYMKFVPVVQTEKLDWRKPEDRVKFARVLAEDFANFQKAFADQPREELESGR